MHELSPADEESEDRVLESQHLDEAGRSFPWWYYQLCPHNYSPPKQNTHPSTLQLDALTITVSTVRRASTDELRLIPLSVPSSQKVRRASPKAARLYSKCIPIAHSARRIVLLVRDRGISGDVWAARRRRHGAYYHCI